MTLEIQIDRIVRSGRKTVAVEVTSDAAVIVRAPHRVPERRLMEFVRQKAEWIAEKQAQARRRAQERDSAARAAAGTVLFLGRPYSLAFSGEGKPALCGDALILPESARQDPGAAVEKWLRGQARELLTRRANHFAAVYGLEYRSLSVTGARTRWGSCGPNNTLNFSFRLVGAPMEAIDYVVVHELCHTRHHNHSRAFWQQVAGILPDYPHARRWLAENGAVLMR